MKRIYVLPALLLAACGINPTSGTYVMVAEDSVGTCNFIDDSGASTGGSDSMTITVADDGTTFDFVGGDLSVTCPLDGVDFDCMLQEETQDYSSKGMDVVATITMNMAGSWIEDTSIEGDITVELVCEGQDCALLATQGVEECTSSWAFTAEIAE